MTKSRDKAKDGYIKVAINRNEYWLAPQELEIDGKTVGDILAENAALQFAFDNYTANTNLTLQKLIDRQKELERDLAKYHNALIEFMGDIIKGGQ